MAVKAGYKQSEVGVIPEDWEVVTLGSGLCSKPSYGVNAPAVPYSDRLPTYIRITDIDDDGRFAPSTLVSVNLPDTEAYFLEDGDIVFARTGATVGKSYLYQPTDGRLVYAGFLIRVRPDSINLYAPYVAEFVKTGTFWRWVRLMSMRSGQPGINGNEFAQMPIPKPPLPEQRAIAAALSDVDALLAALDRLLAKKRAVKQAAMQQLLTGQTRLPGFGGEWESRRIDEVADTDPESLGNNTAPDYKFNYIALEDVDRGTLVSFSEQTFSSAPSRARRKIQADDILVATVRPNLQSHLLFPYLEGEWVCSTGFCVVRCRTSDADPHFIFQHLFSSTINQQIDMLIAGSNYPAINSADVRALKIAVPSIQEQTAIAAVLSDMDAELAALARRRAKTRDVKQAMMQELLTGRTRLV